MNFEAYYRLLNCGLRLVAGAGSATGAKTTPVGYNQTYVRAGPNPTLPAFLEAWRKGRNFVTNGPVVFLRTGEDRRPGDTIALPSRGDTVSFAVTARSEQALRTLEIVVNGKVVAKASIAAKEYKAKLGISLALNEGAWVAARCTEEDQLLSDHQLSRYNGGDTFAEDPCRSRYAHASLIYVTVGGKGPCVPSSVKEGRAMLESFEHFPVKQRQPSIWMSYAK